MQLLLAAVLPLQRRTTIDTLTRNLHTTGLIVLLKVLIVAWQLCRHLLEVREIPNEILRRTKFLLFVSQLTHEDG